MIKYIISPDKTLKIAKKDNSQPVMVIMNVEEFRSAKENFLCYKELLRSLGSIRYCKAEFYKGCIFGTLRIPQKSEQMDAQISCAFYVTDKILYIINDTGDMKRWVDKNSERLGKMQSPDQLLLDILRQMTENDSLYLAHLEKKLEDMEDSLADNISDTFFSELTKYRRKLSELNNYYDQLTDMGEMMQSGAFTAVVQDPAEWERYSHGMDRLQNHVKLLRENILQLRELYQSKQDARQNKIMCILTVVTTLFLPLTLLTGWYGMNFANMPELQWKYGYLTVIIVAVAIVVVEIIYFKKKKFF